MVANIDHNVGLLQEKLDALGLTENTILIFMTDNGTANGAAFGKDTLNSEAVAGYNAGMRGKKSSIYEGGHRVPLFIRWPAGGLSHGNDLNHLSAHLDVLPTLAQLCGIGIAESHQMDGISFAEALRSPSASPHRDHLIVQFQGGAYFRQPPAEWEFACVLTKRWRLLDNGELYDMADDPAQRNDVAATHPYIVKKLRELYSPFWSSVAARMTPVHIDIGSPTENPTVLCSQDWYMPNGNPPWNFGSIRKLPPVTGPWKIHVRKAGRYRMTLRQFPVEANLPVYAVRASVRIGEKEQESSVKPGSKGVVFEEVLPAGRTELWTYLYDERGKVGGAYFTEVEALAP